LPLPHPGHQGVAALSSVPRHASLGDLLDEDQQAGATPFSPGCTKDLVEEGLFERQRDLFTELELVFFDTTSIYFEGGA
jgi:hypothetical protein